MLKMQDFSQLKPHRLRDKPDIFNMIFQLQDRHFNNGN
jgi:hypothetical protein